MALRLLQPGIQPLGQFDGYDDDYLVLKGGEVGSLMGLALTGDRAAKDADGSDGYTGTTSKTRPAVTRRLLSGMRPLFLLDEGTTYYGTLFGSVVGGVAGQLTTGTALGPHTAQGSGKVTCWDKPGLYAVTLDAVDTTASTGLVPGNAAMTVGDPLYATAQGLLTPNSSLSFETSPTNLVVARFIEFSTDGHLVNTPNYLVSAANSPSGSNPTTVAFTQAVIHFSVEGQQ